jgi:predicted nucleotide-binding protein
MKFNGSLDELKDVVTACGLAGEWSKRTEPVKVHVFRGESGQILNWWPSGGTVQFQGKHQEEFRALFSNAQNMASVTEPKKTRPVAKAFVAPGRAREAGDKLQAALARLSLQPYIVRKLDGDRGALIEALEQYIDQENGFGIVIFIPKA